MLKNKPELLSRKELIDKMQLLCEQKLQPSSLVFIEINNAIQVARILQGFWAEQQLIKVVEQIIIEHVAGHKCLHITKINHHLFALVFVKPMSAVVEIVESLAGKIDQTELEIIDSGNKTDTKVYYPKLNIGVTPLTPYYKQPESAVTAVEEALYQARNVGNSIVRVVQPGNQKFQRYFDRLQLLPVLRAGLVENSFILYAQPIAPIDPQQDIKKAEVLLRYRDKEGRVELPDNFLQSAALFYVSREIDLYVVENYCRFMQKQSTDIVYSLNISGSTVRYPQFFDFVKRQFKKFAIDPQQVCFEITENVANKDFEQASQLMFRLKNELGCLLSLDDIGIGSSNLANLPKFHVDYLKIDGYFVQHLLNEPYSEQVIRFITASAKLLNKKTIAEFVEHEEQRKKLHELGVDFIQGYLSGRPELLFDPGI